MKVLILGSSGFVGFPIAKAFVRNGHEVYGQIRAQSKAKLLASEEIIPVIADVSNGAALVDAAAAVDVVINCLGGGDLVALTDVTYKVVIEAAKKARGSGIPKLTYILISGTWVYGEDRINMINERSPLTHPASLVSWRPATEQTVVNSKEVDGIVIRPSLLYGGSASLIEPVFKQAATGGKIEWPGRLGGRWALIHNDDLSDLVLRVAEAAPICKGLIFDASNSQTELVEDILAKVVEVSGASGFTLREPANPYEEAQAGTAIMRPSLARAILGWTPKKAGFVDGMRTYYAAWQATQ
ncbi:NAD(P)-binding protein [Rickenella mellea]|uniref:NAD(P)-binding protein n=1 Tax=Rickenella mellea TaxID=50990 RepID=A0A4Y7PPE1_9AGAM|nr:NAD(P)-binding protein [Rickenella mellea]